MRADRVIDMAKHSSFKPGTRSLDWNESTSTLLVGTRGAEIWEVDENDGVKCHMHGHYAGEVWGIATHPEKPDVFISCGGD